MLDLYKGDLREGCYRDWALREREQLRTLYVKSLIYLLKCYGFQDLHEKAITYGHQIPELDSLREEIHRGIMRLCLANGQRDLSKKN